MERWGVDARARRRRRALFAFAALAHGVLVGGMLRARLTHERARAESTVEATLWLPPPPVATPAVALPPPPPRASRLRSIPHPVLDPAAIQAPPLEWKPVAQAASAPQPPASAPLPPLNLTLSRDQLRSIIADTKPTLGQMLARPPAPSALSQVGGDGSTYSEKSLPGGETEVRSHGGCFRMVPTARSQYDPFNHGGEHLTAPCN